VHGAKRWSRGRPCGNVSLDGPDGHVHTATGISIRRSTGVRRSNTHRNGRFIFSSQRPGVTTGFADWDDMVVVQASYQDPEAGCRYRLVWRRASSRATLVSCHVLATDYDGIKSIAVYKHSIHLLLALLSSLLTIRNALLENRTLKRGTHYMLNSFRSTTDHRLSPKLIVQDHCGHLTLRGRMNVGSQFVEMRLVTAACGLSIYRGQHVCGNGRVLSFISVTHYERCGRSSSSVRGSRRSRARKRCKLY
jgi:hypothetical protein